MTHKPRKSKVAVGQMTATSDRETNFLTCQHLAQVILDQLLLNLSSLQLRHAKEALTVSIQSCMNMVLLLELTLSACACHHQALVAS